MTDFDTNVIETGYKEFTFSGFRTISDNSDIYETILCSLVASGIFAVSNCIDSGMKYCFPN